MWLSLQKLCPVIGPLIFRILGYLNIPCNHVKFHVYAHIALQELWVVLLMPCRLTFCLSGKVVTYHWDNKTAKAYFCNQGGTVFPFPSTLVCCILNLINKHHVTLIQSCIHTNFNVQDNYMLFWRIFPKFYLLPRITTSVFQLWICGRGFVGTFMYQSMTALLHL